MLQGSLAAGSIVTSAASAPFLRRSRYLIGTSVDAGYCPSCVRKTSAKGSSGAHVYSRSPCSFLMMRMQVRLRPAPWRNRDQMHTQPLRSGCLGGHTRKIVEVLLPGVGFPSLNHHANWFGAGLHVASLRPSLARYGTVGTARGFRCHYSDLRVPSRRKYLPAMNDIGNSLRQPE